MAAVRAVKEPFVIHEDVRTEETEMIDEENPLVVTEDDVSAMATEDAAANEEQERLEAEEEGEEDEEEDDEDDDEDGYDSSDDEQIDRSVMTDMNKLAEDFPSFTKKYRLIKRIGEG